MQLKRWLTRFLPETAVNRLDSRSGRFLSILGLISLVNAAMFALVFYLVVPSEEGSSELIARTLWTLYFVIMIISGVLAWFLLMTRESRVIAQEESLHQTQRLMNEIEAHRKTDRELQQAKETAEAANLAKSRYLAGISHELRTPLQSILGYAQLLGRDEDMAERHRESIGVVRRSGEYLADLIEGLLDISRIEAGKLEIRREQVDLKSLLEELVDMFAPLAQEKSLAFRADISRALPRHVNTDEKRLRQILINLLSNALKFTNEGEVALTVNYRSQVAEIRVEDTGVGIAEHNIERAFNPFERISNPGLNAPGTGLGLTIVKLLVECMGGDIAVQSEPGKGSSFVVLLMLSSIENPRALSEPDRDITGYDGPRLTVMVVDDDAQHRRLMTDLLAPLGFKVVCAASATQCLVLLGQHRADLFLIDVSMPGMNGLELVRVLRERGEAAPAIIISADAQERHGDLQQECYHDDFMVKPIRLSVLLKRISRHLDLQWRYGSTDSDNAQAAERLAFTVPLPDMAQFSRLRAYAEIGYLKGVTSELDSLRKDPSVDNAVVKHLDQLARHAQLEKMADFLKENS